MDIRDLTILTPSKYAVYVRSCNTTTVPNLYDQTMIVHIF